MQRPETLCLQSCLTNLSRCSRSLRTALQLSASSASASWYSQLSNWSFKDIIRIHLLSPEQVRVQDAATGTLGTSAELPVQVPGSFRPSHGTVTNQFVVYRVCAYRVQCKTMSCSSRRVKCRCPKSAQAQRGSLSRRNRTASRPLCEAVNHCGAATYLAVGTRCRRVDLTVRAGAIS